MDKSLFLDCPAEFFADLSSAGYGKSADLNLELKGDSILVKVRCPNSGLRSVVLRWANPFSGSELVLGDNWERGYGELGWKAVNANDWHPWYIAFQSVDGTAAVGVRTQCCSFASWSLSKEHIELHLDLRSGSQPVQLGDREILAAQIVCGAQTGASSFQFVREFCHHLCENPLRTETPVFGANDWYYAYGNNTGERIVRDSERVSDWCRDLSTRPFSVIDAGWHPSGGCEPGPRVGNDQFGDMSLIANRIRETGCRPGLWIRPLKTGTVTTGLMKGDTLDPSIPENLDIVRTQIAECRSWGYELIKHDFTTFDITGQWGFEMKGDVFGLGESFRDDTRTTAEIILNLYQAIREGAGEALLLGCNTFGHLTAGTHEIHRIGDDTSGQEWERTRKMGINSLAFRGVQQGAFFQADADCVGITKDIPWSLNRQWLDLIAHSGTPLFVSADAEVLSSDQVSELRAAFKTASQPREPIEPLDWVSTKTPTEWKSGNERFEYFWEDTELVDSPD